MLASTSVNCWQHSNSSSPVVTTGQLPTGHILHYTNLRLQGQRPARHALFPACFLFVESDLDAIGKNCDLKGSPKSFRVLTLGIFHERLQDW